MTNIVDRLLNGITMYRLLLYFLIGLLVIAGVLGQFGLVAYGPIEIAASTLFLVAVSWLINKTFSFVFEAPTNVESVYLTALILALIIAPAKSLEEFLFLFWAAVLAIASKFILAIYRKHIFNPAAIAVVITAITLGETATWWSSTMYMIPVILIGGLLIMRKVRMEEMVFYFFATASITALIFTLINSGDPFTTLTALATRSSLFFLAFVMLTEPITAPPTKTLQAIYAAIVGILFVPQVHIGGLYFTPELALVIGNIFAYAVSPKRKLFVHLKQKIQAAPDIIDFIFAPQKRMNFVPGQYMEWTLPHPSTDSRGNRRYFTIASSPTEPDIRLGVKFYENGSTYKKAMSTMNDGDMIVGAQLAGDFTLPTDVNQKLVFIAGGIGITPFRSMIKYLVDTGVKRDIVLLYTNTVAEQVVYTDVFTEAVEKLGIKTIYTLTKKELIPPTWTGNRGRFDAALIQSEIPDYRDRTFYISGSQRLVDGMKQLLRDMGVPQSKVVTDFFPGLM